jgi:sugar phosphate isomerase/epimerase
MLPIKLAVASGCFQGPPKHVIKSAAEIGAAGLQFNARGELRPAEFSETGRRQLLHYLKDFDLGVSSLTFPTRRGLAHADGLDARMAGIRAAMQFAAQLQARRVVVSTGRIPGEHDSQEYMLLCEVLNDLARYGNHVGAILCLSTTSGSSAELKPLIERVDGGPLGVSFDPAAFAMSGQDPLESLRLLHNLVLHVRVRDAVCDGEGEGREVPVGRGEVPWDEFLALLEEAGFQDWYTVDRTQGSNRAQEAAAAISYLRTVISEA